MYSSNFKGLSSTFQFHLPWRSTVSNPLNSSRDGNLFTNHTPTSTEYTRPDPSERSHAQSQSHHRLQNVLAEDLDESAIDVNLLLDSLATQFPDAAGGADQLHQPSMFDDFSDQIAAVNQEECVDLKPLLSFDNSDELFINNIGKIESTFNVETGAAAANYIVINKTDRYDNLIPNNNNNKHTNSNIYKPEILSAAQSPSTADNMEEEFFVQRAYGATADSAETLDFAFGDNDFILDDSSVLNGASLTTVSGRDANVKEEVFYDTPENSSSPRPTPKPVVLDGFRGQNVKIFDLPKMDLSTIGVFQDELHTPDIIESIMEYDEKFQLPLNKQNQVKTVTLTNVIAEDMPSTSNSVISFVNSPSSGVPSPASSVKKSSKRRRYEDDSDEDYVDDENDKDYVPFEEPVKKPKRGRPPKRGKSISSDDYSQLDPQEARYREMRDRNNEASRRSRYKRKQKEMKVVDELAVEEEKNIRLKAKVEELQKTVDRFRDSLMKVMLSKR